MIIPGWGNLEVETMILDLNGTIATDGKIPQTVRESIQSLSARVKIYVVTADTQGTAGKEMAGLGVEWIKAPEADSTQEKLGFLKSLDPQRTVAIGNGDNDHLILKEASLGIAVMGDEGLSISAMQNADVVVKNIADALDLFLRPNRLIATLRR